MLRLYTCNLNVSFVVHGVKKYFFILTWMLDNKIIICFRWYNENQYIYIYHHRLIFSLCNFICANTIEMMIENSVSSAYAIILIITNSMFFFFYSPTRMVVSDSD